MTRVIGWDIGGVHLKAAGLDLSARPPRLVWRLRGFEIWKGPGDLARHLRDLRDDLSARHARRVDAARHAVTMTAELSDTFASRAQGVRFILAACRKALGRRVVVLDHDGRLVALETAVRAPERIAAANWMAPAVVAARALGTRGLFIDVGSTTTDIVPLARGAPAPRGRTDRDRLVAGELVYTGILRTPPAALADRVPLDGAWCRPAPEAFAIMADVWRLLGRVGAGDYSVPTPDGRGRDVPACAARLARLVCSEPRDLGREGLLRIARSLARRQVDVIAEGVGRVAARLPGARHAVVAGAGAFLGVAAARRAGLRAVAIERLLPGLGRGWGRVAPAAALAILLRDQT